MTRRRNSINIYDYPEHLNPFRDDVDDESEKFNTTGRRRPSFRANAWAMFSGNKAGERPSEEEVKYLQQGAKPKKKRRAPLPPGPSPPSKSPGDNQQANSNESEASLTSSVTSSNAEGQTSISASPDLKDVQEPETHPVNEKPESNLPVNDNKENTENGIAKDPPPEEENGLISKLDKDVSNSEDNKDEIDARINPENKISEDKKVQNEEKKTEEIPLNGKDSLENVKVDFNVVLHISEEDLRDKDLPIQNGSHSESDVNHNVEHTENRDTVKTNSHVKDEEKELQLCNGENGLNENDLSETEMKLNSVNRKRSPSKTPEPKPRTILPAK